MYLYKSQVSNFIQSSGSVYETLTSNFKTHYGYYPSSSEIGSWERSLPELAAVLAAGPAGLANGVIYLEYEMPGVSKRADALVIGCDTKRKRYGKVVELKQWSCASVGLGNDRLINFAGEDCLHPSEQAADYRDYLTDLSKAFSPHTAELKSSAFLHNCISSAAVSLRDSRFRNLQSESPLFCKDELTDFAFWLGSGITMPPDPFFEEDMDEQGSVISKQLFRVVEEAIKDHGPWKLLNEQKVAYKLILDAVGKRDRQKRLILVEGGPGTGKSAIAMQVMGELCRQQVKTIHVTNSKAFTTVTKSHIIKRGDRRWGSAAVNALFLRSHNFIRPKDHYEVAICDEAHRWRMTTDFRPNLYSRRVQADELFDCTDTVVAFVDEKQILRRAEAGTIQYWEESAARSGVSPENIIGPIHLQDQFRSAGNRDFVFALDRILYEGTTERFLHRNFRTGVVDDPNELDGLLSEGVHSGFRSRLLAGFCWEWSDPEPDGSLVEDVKLPNWSRPWNRKAPKGRSLPADQDPYTIWAEQLTDDLSEVGCIFSAQGFEFDYVGIIWANDLVWRNDKWVAQPEYSHDGDLWVSEKRTVAPEVALPLLKNAYRVLCSRAMRACYIYAQDQETSAKLKEVFG